MQKDGIKDRKYQGVLYPDSESYSPLGLCGLYCYSNYKGAFGWIMNS